MILQVMWELFLIEGISSDIAENIFSEQGIALRGGLQCSPLAHKFLGTSPAGTVRFSTSYFTSEEDFLHLEKVLKYLNMFIPPVQKHHIHLMVLV